MFFNIARCNEFFGKMLYFGSGAEFGRPNWIPLMPESYFDVYVPDDPYGLSKYIMTKHTYEATNIYNLRLFGVAGEKDDWRYRFISLASCKAAYDMPITFRQNVFFDFLYISVGLSTMILSQGYLEKMGSKSRGEYPALILFSVIGMMLMTRENDLVMVFLGLELLSLSLYVLV